MERETERERERERYGERERDGERERERYGERERETEREREMEREREREREREWERETEREMERGRERQREREWESATCLSVWSAAATSGRDHFCDYATGTRPLAANHKNATDRHVPSEAPSNTHTHARTHTHTHHTHTPESMERDKGNSHHQSAIFFGEGGWAQEVRRGCLATGRSLVRSPGSA